MRFSIDTNVLFYTFDAGDERLDAAHRLLRTALLADCVLTNQVLGEFLNAVRHRFPDKIAQARDAVASWALVFSTAPTDTADLLVASGLAERRHLQFWDSVILTVAKRAGAICLLTEDMQDGADIDGVRIINPFAADNAELLDVLLTPPPGTA